MSTLKSDTIAVSEIADELYGECRPSNCDTQTLRRLLDGENLDSDGSYEAQATCETVSRFIERTGVERQEALERLYVASAALDITTASGKFAEAKNHVAGLRRAREIAAEEAEQGNRPPVEFDETGAAERLMEEALRENE